MRVSSDSHTTIASMRRIATTLIKVGIRIEESNTQRSCRFAVSSEWTQTFSQHLKLKSGQAEIQLNGSKNALLHWPQDCPLKDENATKIQVPAPTPA